MQQESKSWKELNIYHRAINTLIYFELCEWSGNTRDVIMLPTVLYSRGISTKSHDVVTVLYVHYKIHKYSFCTYYPVGTLDPTHVECVQNIFWC